MSVYSLECAVLVVGILALVLVRVGHDVRAMDGRVNLTAPLLVGLAERVGAILVADGLGSTGDELRGRDDAAFFDEATRLAGSAGLSEWASEVTGNLHTVTNALLLKVLDAPGDPSLRIVQAGFALIGVALLGRAVARVAGARPALIATWLIALEPTGAFFSTVLQKESLAFLAVGLCALGFAGWWRDPGRRADAAMVGAGIVLVGLVRPYIALAFFGAAALVALHAQLEARGRPSSVATAFVVAAGLVVFGAGVVAAPRLASGQLTRLQQSQDSVPFSSDSLRLGPVTVTDTPGLARTSVTRSFDLITRPRPWQLETRNQQVGAAATLFWWAVLGGLLVGLLHLPRVWAPVLPFLYLAAAQTLLYALTATNAGTGFRHRLHIVALAICALSILVSASLPRERRSDSRASQRFPFRRSGSGRWRVGGRLGRVRE